MQNNVQQLSLLEPVPQPALQLAQRASRQALSGVELEVAMRQVFKGWARWHRCKQFEQAVADPVTKRLLELAAKRGP